MYNFSELSAVNADKKKEGGSARTSVEGDTRPCTLAPAVQSLVQIMFDEVLCMPQRSVRTK